MGEGKLIEQIRSIFSIYQAQEKQKTAIFQYESQIITINQRQEEICYEHKLQLNFLDSNERARGNTAKMSLKTSCRVTKFLRILENKTPRAYNSKT